MWTARTRLLLLYGALLLLIGASGLVLGAPGLSLILDGRTGPGWIRLGTSLLLDLGLIIAVGFLARLPTFRSEPVDWTLPRAERKMLSKEEEQRYRAAKVSRREHNDL